MAEKTHCEQSVEVAKPPSSLQRLFAIEWIWTVGFVGIATSAALCLGMLAFPNIEQIIVLALAGSAGGALLAWVLIKVTWGICVRINGGPFHEDDWVQVIRGRDAGKIARVYEVWPSRNQARIDLGENARRDGKDVFSIVQLRRMAPRSDVPQPAQR